MKATTLLFTTMCLALPAAAFAQAPTIQTEGPIIHLADNLDEEEKLGWCIDTEGRGQSDKLHAHSCKPTGDDVLFSYLPDSNMIQSGTYDDVCMAYNDPEHEENPFGLIPCDPADASQTFIHDEASMEIRLGMDETQCVTVSPTIDNAGPFQSRDLLLAACDTLQPSFKQWVIRE